MNIADVRRQAFAMPLTSPAFPPGPYRFVDREFLIITYRTDPDALRARGARAARGRSSRWSSTSSSACPIPPASATTPNRGQVIPVAAFRQGREQGGYTHCMFLDDHPPIAGGRELWGFPKKLASPMLDVETDTLVGTLDYGPVRVATATMGFKHRALDPAPVLAAHRAAELPAQDHPARRRHARASASWSTTISRTSRCKGAWTGAGRAGAAPARAGAGGRAAGAGGDLGRPLSSPT